MGTSVVPFCLCKSSAAVAVGWGGRTWHAGPCGSQCESAVSRQWQDGWMRGAEWVLHMSCIVHLLMLLAVVWTLLHFNCRLIGTVPKFMCRAFLPPEHALV